MCPENVSKDNGSNLNVPEKLMKDLKGLYGARSSVPKEIDDLVLQRASEKFAGRGGSGLRIIRWFGPIAAAAAAAAVIIYLFGVSQVPDEAMQADSNAIVIAREDIDLSGRVDILDAFKLAKQIEITAAVNQEWDMNGDGEVDRADVDFVASAAVRLDRGVL